MNIKKRKPFLKFQITVYYSCKLKRELYLASRKSNNSTTREHFKSYCKILSNVNNPSNAKLNFICHFLVLLGAHPILHLSRIRVKEVKRLNYDTQI